MLPGTGNSVADYKVRYEWCLRCDGRGKVSIDKDNLREHLEYLQQNYGFGFRDLLRECRILKRNHGVVECPECEGKGKHETWY